MWHENHAYGHSNILAGYCGLDPTYPPLIPGVLQHGWNSFDGFSPHLKNLDSLTRFCWSKRAERFGRRLTPRHTVAVGSPWIYLLSTLGDLQVARTTFPNPSSTIVYPSHSNITIPQLLDHEELAREIRKGEGDRDVTVVLYWVEYQNPSIRSAYENLGMRVVSHGTRSFEYDGGTDAFLMNQYLELKSHERIISNKLSTALLYGASLGLEVELVGVSGHVAVPGLTTRQRNLFGEAFIKQLVPCIFEGRPADGEKFFDFSMAELGADCILKPMQLSELFGWGKSQNQRTLNESLLVAHAKSPSKNGLWSY